MGGKAIKSAERLTKQEYQEVTNRLTELLRDVGYSQMGTKHTFGFPTAYSAKESFGDIDLLVTHNKLSIAAIVQMMVKTGELEVVENAFNKASGVIQISSDVDKETFQYLERKTELTPLKEQKAKDLKLSNPHLGHYEINNVTSEVIDYLLDKNLLNNDKVNFAPEMRPTTMPMPPHYSMGVKIRLNNGTWSKVFQLDFIFTNINVFGFHLNYLSWNDLGNFIGRIATYFGFKFGSDGFFYRLYIGNNMKVLDGVSQYKTKNDQSQAEKVLIKDYVLISPHVFNKDEDNFPHMLSNLCFKEVLDVLGFDSKRYKQGFNTLEEIADFVYQSKYFNIEMFKLENRDSKSRARDKKRPSYNTVMDFFQKWCDEGKPRKFSPNGETFELTITDINRAFPKAGQTKRSYVKSLLSNRYLQNRLNIGHVYKIMHKKGFYFEHELAHFNVVENEVTVLPSELAGSLKNYLKDKYTSFGLANLQSLSRNKMRQFQREALMEWLQQNGHQVS